ncbi:MAG: hypothetical protein M3464_08835 [Chloroflexota bacterium]|nr:hypothetical protein [Chloroflexota bacterium]
MPPRAMTRSLEDNDMMQTFRLLAGITAVLVLVQAVLAGQWIGGDLAIIVTHGWLGSGTLLLALLMTGISLAGGRQGWLDGRAVGLSATLVVLVVAQLGLGYAGRSSAVAASLHIPLGVLIFGLAMVLLVSALPLRLSPADARTR